MVMSIEVEKGFGKIATALFSALTGAIPVAMQVETAVVVTELAVKDPMVVKALPFRVTPVLMASMAPS